MSSVSATPTPKKHARTLSQQKVDVTASEERKQHQGHSPQQKEPQQEAPSRLKKQYSRKLSTSRRTTASGEIVTSDGGGHQHLSKRHSESMRTTKTVSGTTGGAGDVDKMDIDSKNLSAILQNAYMQAYHQKELLDPRGGSGDTTIEEEYNTTWGEVCRSCFIHSPSKWIVIIFYWVLLLACLYIFGLGLELLGTGAKVMTGCVAGELFGANSQNPVAGVMIGILATVMLQSSSTTTSIIVGLVGAEHSIFTVDQGIYMIMGANIGTTITNTIVSLLQFQHQNRLADAFAGATIHDIFNFLTVAILLPVEVLTGYLHHLTEALVRGSNTENGDKWEGPVKTLITPLAEKIIIANKGLTNSVASGGSCNDFYPILCDDEDNPTYHTCERFGLIACDKHKDQCPLFFDPNADVLADKSAGLVALCIGLFLIFIALVGLVQVVMRLLTGVSLRIIHKATDFNGYILILIGTGITTVLQSSSTTTSFLTPMVGVGALRLEQMYPLTIGANIGTTITAVLAALVTDGDAALQVALAHLLFNITGFLIWYPIQSVRRIPVIFARRLGQYARVWRPFTLLYLFGAFFLLPLVCIGLSAMFNHDKKGLVVLGGIVTAFMILLLLFWMRWFYFCGGRAEVYKYLSENHIRYTALLTITTDMEHIKERINFHEEYAGITIKALPGIVTTSSNEEKEKKGTAHSSTKSKIQSSKRESYVGRNDFSESMEVYASERAAHQKLVQQALETVAEDVQYLKAGLAILSHHTGIADNYDDSDEDDSDDSSEDDDGSSSDDISNFTGRDVESSGTPKKKKAGVSGRKKKSILDLRSLLQFSTFSHSTLQNLWSVTPISFVLGAAIAFLALLGGIVALFFHGGIASRGAAYFLIGVFVLSVLFTCFFFDPRALHAYFRNKDKKKRQETINALPVDVKMLKRKLRRILEHYKLEVDEILLGSSASAEMTESS